MVSDMAAFERRVLEFHDATHMAGVFGQVTPNDRFRQGKTDEWRSTISPEMQEWMNNQMSEPILRTFGWTA